MMTIKQLEKDILKHKILYYKGESEISDEDYDDLEEALKKLDPKNKVLLNVGAPVVNNKIKHDEKMISLSKTYKIEELIKWKETNDLISTFKIDGSSCSLVYVDGELIIGKTRGDGSFGENITSKVVLLPSVLKKIKTNYSKCEIRGEVFCTDENFLILTQKMEELELDKPTSKRNIVAGLLGRKESIDLCKYLNFQAFELISDELDLKLESEKFKKLDNFGFDIPEYIIHRDENSIENTLKEAQDFMLSGNYLIDGIVFTFNILQMHEELGSTSHHPRFKMAFKFQGTSKVASIKSITWQVSRNGILTPVAEIEPIELSGAMISRVTLHNYGLVEANKLKEKDKIEIVRSGEVIPKFLSIKESSKEEFVTPSICPSCEGSLEKSYIRLICNNKKCPDKVLEEFTYFVSKIGIDDLSRKRLQEMIRVDLVKSIPELFELTEEKLLTLDKVKEKMASKIMRNINSVKEVDLLKFICSMGINGGAQSKCEKIIHSGFHKLDDFLNISVESLMAIEGFAEKSSSDFYSSLNSKKELISALIDHGFKVKEIEKRVDSKISGMRFCITGSLTRKRSEIQKAIKDNSGIVISSVSKNTDYLVTNDINSSSSKFKKALELNIPIISEDSLFLMIGG
jgi:DNA ligase (NAD+)